VYLDVAQRGKGLGKQVVQHILSEAPKFGVKTILGYIFAHNEPSIKLFKGFGFEPWATLPNIATLDGVERSLYIFGKRVA
jgi:phosphinothricin acetyltransferase